MTDAFEKAWDEVDETGIAWTTTDEKPLVIEHAGKTFRVWPEHHDHSGTVQWIVELDGQREALGMEAGPDDTEEEIRQALERYGTSRLRRQ